MSHSHTTDQPRAPWGLDTGTEKKNGTHVKVRIQLKLSSQLCLSSRDDWKVREDTKHNNKNLKVHAVKLRFGYKGHYFHSSNFIMFSSQPFDMSHQESFLL